jgi:hypothetical protein
MESLNKWWLPEHLDQVIANEQYQVCPNHG